MFTLQACYYTYC